MTCSSAPASLLEATAAASMRGVPLERIARGRPARRASAPAANGLATGRRLHGLRLERRLDEPVMQELLGIEEGQRARARAEHDHEELLAAAPGGHGEVVACLLREARLERLHATRIAEERDVPRVDAAAIDECLPAEQRTRHRVVVD